MADLGQDLIDAATGGQLEAVRTLLGQGANVDSRDDARRTSLYCAASRGDVKMVELLLDSGASVDVLSRVARTPLFEASYRGHLAVVKLLVATGANVNHRGKPTSTALHIAAFYDRLEIFLFLISKGADLSAINSQGATALGWYGQGANPPLSIEILAARRNTLEKAWRAGPHPSQVQRRRDEAWDRRKSLMQVTAENGYRPLLHRQLAEKAAIVSLDPAAAIPGIEIDTPAKLHAHLLGQVLSNEGIHRHIVSFL